MIITFHGIMTNEFLRGFNGRGFVQQWLAIRSNVWMRVGTPCTYIFTDDVDHNASITQGKIVLQARIHAIPGHVSGVSHNSIDALNTICNHHFRGKDVSLEWLRKLTQEGRIEESKTCNCSIQQLMQSGCKCGSI